MGEFGELMERGASAGMGGQRERVLKFCWSMMSLLHRAVNLAAVASIEVVERYESILRTVIRIE